MKYLLTRFVLMMLLVTLISCSTLDHREKTISISGVIEVSLVANSGKYWIDNGPLFVANRNPLITYRVISKDELEFAGSKKTVYEFFESSFSDPEGISEEAFRNSHESYEFHKKIIRGLTIYVFYKANESKAYIVSNSMHFGLEVYAEGPTSNVIVNKIIDSTRLTKGN
ncbi:MAG: hypothetical protein L3J88_08750 [Gammaproteobacteria bacterium]|nr:hypothetical protein [Gammaproteobacteria bacterium]MCF6363417.1 hypothetical protein [Gammaproteobacteria bacterium]